MSRDNAGLSRLTDGGHGSSRQTRRAKSLWLLWPDTGAAPGHLSAAARQTGGHPPRRQPLGRGGGVGVQADRPTGCCGGREGLPDSWARRPPHGQALPPGCSPGGPSSLWNVATGNTAQLVRLRPPRSLALLESLGAPLGHTGRLSGACPFKGPHRLCLGTPRVPGTDVGQKAGKVGWPGLLLGATRGALTCVLQQERGPQPGRK